MGTAVDTQHYSIIIKFENEMTAGAMGAILLNTEKIYNILNKKMIHKQSLTIESITKGSYVIDFLGNPEIMKSMHSLWDLVGGNAVWDLVKMAGGFVSASTLLLLKRLLKNKTDSNVRDTELIAKSMAAMMTIAAKNKYDIIFDYKNSKVIYLDGTNSVDNKRKRDIVLSGMDTPAIDVLNGFTDFLIEDGMGRLEDLPTRKARLGRARHKPRNP